MKSLRKNTLLILLLGSATILAACNSGSPAPNNGNNSQSSLTQKTALMTIPASVEGDEEAPSSISLDGGDLASSLLDDVGDFFMDEVLGIAFNPNTVSNNQLYSAIQQNYTNLAAALSNEQSSIQEIIGIINNNELVGLNTTLQKVLTNINDYNAATQDLINDALNNTSYATPTLNSFTMQSSQPVSESALQLMANYMPTVPSKVKYAYLYNTVGSGSLDSYEQNLSCDIFAANPGYTLNNASNIAQHYLPPLSGATQCGVAAYLNASLTALFTGQFQNEQITKLQITSGQNAFFTLWQYYKGLDILHVKIATALQQAYLIDQLRLNMGLQNPNAASIPLVVSGYSVGLNNYANALQELTYAYNDRLNMVESLFDQTKDAAYKQLIGNSLYAKGSNVTSECNLNYESIANLSESQISATAANANSTNGNYLSWDGQYLTTQCSSPHYNSIITTTNIGDLCQQTTYESTNSYYITSSNGYIRCGSGNYSYNSIANAQIAPNYLTYYGVVSRTAPKENWFNTPDPMVNYTSGYGAQDIITFENENNLIWWNSYNKSLAPTFTVNGMEWEKSVSGGNTVMSAYVNDANTYFFNYTPVKNAMTFVDDGTHVFLIGGAAANECSPFCSDAHQYYSAIYLQCLDYDDNCVSGVFANPSALSDSTSDYMGIRFSNGDVIAVTQQGGIYGWQAHNAQTTGQYTAQSYYGASCGPSSIENASGILDLNQSNSPAASNGQCTAGYNGSCGTTQFFQNVGYGASSNCS